MNGAKRLIVVDDERGMRDMLAFELGNRGFRVDAFESGERALELLKTEVVPLVITDVRMPGLGGIDLLAAVKKLNPDIEVLMMTGFATVDSAVMAMKLGACDFVQKPFSIDELIAVIDGILERKELKAAVAIYQASEALFKTVKLDELLPVITDLAKSVLRADSAALLLTRDGKLEPVVGAGGQCSVETGVCERALAGGEPVLLGPGQCGEGCGAALVFPLKIDGEGLGVLCAGRARSDRFNAQDLRHATIFGSQIALAVRNARAFQSLKEAQVKLVHSERMSAIGNLAAGVAHELNNPLTGIFGCAQILDTSGNLDQSQRDDVRSILEQAQRCREIIRDMLRFVRKDERVRERVLLEDVLETALRLSRFDSPCRQITVALERSQEGLCLIGEARQLQQVFLNLIVNAAHAMADREEKRLEIRLSREGPWAVARVCDTGCGIASENLKRIFEPFFTTKKEGSGTGLGLAICREIVEQHGGTIEAQSVLGRGSTFTVRLPCPQPR